jgi:hypothetical protein
MRVLLNAESFGFGPSAAIAALHPYIKNCKLIEVLDYVGNGHSVDLQRKLKYDTVYEMESTEEFKNLIVNYDVFITALDFEKALWAQECGVKTIIYDTLLWYWRKIPQSIYNCDTYIAQDFYGVKERLQDLNISNVHIVPPMIQKNDNNKKKVVKENIVINFGGLENPHWSILVTTQYIKLMLNYLLPLLKNMGYENNIIIACSKSHLPYLSQYNVKNYSYTEMQENYKSAKFVIATPGLGNLYECANYEVPSLFLPPGNDSQGQQLEILKSKGLVDNSIDWSDLGCDIDYKAHQQEVLKSIKGCIEFHSEQKFNEYGLGLGSCFENKIASLIGNENLKELFSLFGANGTQLCASHIIQSLERVSNEIL